MKTSWLIRAGAGAALLVAGIVIVEETGRGAPGIGRSLERQLSSAPPPTAARTPNPPADPQVLAVRILSRPLFAPGRRPYTAAVEAAAGTLGTADLRLVGIVSFSGAKQALLAVSGNDKAVMVRAGTRIAGRTVQKIEGNRILLSGPNGDETIGMTPMSSAVAAPSPNAIR